MNDIQNNLFTNSTTLGNKTSEKMFTKAERKGKIEFIEREVDKFDFDGYEVVRREFFSKANCPAVTFKYGSVFFNVRTIRKLNECRFVHILIHKEKKSILVKPCEEDEKDSLQWSKVDKHNKVVPRTITGKAFTAQLFKDMNWHLESTVKILGTVSVCKGEKIFEFNLTNAEAYLHVAESSEDETKRRKRVPFMPEHWQGNYGKFYEESKNQMVMTFEGVPDGFVKITIPQLPNRKPSSVQTLKSPDTEISADLFTESIASSNGGLGENVMEAQKDGA